MVKLVTGFVILSVIFWVIERLFPAIPGQKRLRRGFWTDMVYWFFTPLVTRTVSSVGVALALVVMFQTDVAGVKALLENRDTVLARQPLALQAVLMLVIGDFVGYWVHRAFHARRLWNFHAVHHSSEDLDWLSSVRLHPVNDLIGRIIQVVVLVGLGFSPAAIAAYVPFLTFYAILLHANVGWSYGPLAPVIASPVFHRWHHTSQAEGQDKNFAGLFPVFDLLFGTYHMPKDKRPERFGVSGEPLPPGFIGQMLYPFRRSKAGA